MHRNHAWISTLRRLLVAQVFVLLCAAAVWGQDFGTSVEGSATGCGGKKESYEDSNPINSKGEKATPVCTSNPASEATATSQVQLTHPNYHPGHQSGGVAAIQGSGTAMSEAFDTVTLIPPFSFTDLSTVLFISDSWTVTHQGTGSGSVTITWTIPNVFKHSVTTDTAGTQTLNPKISRSDSTSPFQFQIKKTVEASASTSNPETVGAITYSSPNSISEIELPQGKSGGWKCTYASGGPCP